MIDSIPLWFAIPAALVLYPFAFFALTTRFSMSEGPVDLSAADVADGVGSREVMS